MSRRLLKLGTLFVVCALSLPALAQSSPFDMSGERPAETEPQTPPPSAPVTVAPPPTPVQDARRFLVPFEQLTLAGEMDRHVWTFYLTPEQAESPATLNFGYLNAIFVAPEVSVLRVSINGTVVSEEAANASENIKDVLVTLGPGVLKPGINTIAFDSSLRHRTDCSISSTYDLWAEIAPENTYLRFANSDANRPRRLDDVRAVGVDSTGRSEITIVIPQAEQNLATLPLLELSQGLALLIGEPSQSTRIVNEVTAAEGPGRLTVLFGTADGLATLIPELPPQARSAPTIEFSAVQGSTSPLLIITGPTWADVGQAVQQVTTPNRRPISIRRTTLSNSSWSAPDAPFLLGQSSVELSSAGVATSEFSGRRFRTGFNIGVPSDFYAKAYGEAQLLLDAAYSQEILPGSHFDIYVNGNMATTVPLGSRQGEVLRQLPVKITMQHFVPGLNEITLEAVLLTEQDTVCAPGTTASNAVRFALFDTSRFVMPDFARIGTRPNLGAMRGTGFPYNRQIDKLPLVIDRSSPQVLSATASLISKIAMAGGRIIDIDTDVPVANLTDRDAIFIGSLQQLPSSVLPAVGVTATNLTSWGEPSTQAGTSRMTEDAINRWSNEVGSNWYLPLERLTNWLSDSFGLSFEALRLMPGSDQPFTPNPQSGLVIAQGESPNDGGAWLVVTAPKVEEIQDGMEKLVQLQNWHGLQGRAISYNLESQEFDHVPLTNVRYVVTQPLTYSNLRLIFANAFSENILFYTLVLVVLFIVLGIATTLLTRGLGRHT
ncbi:cellulose biosynthesis cyclic di-GMP-binding regulatory protein BcsB [Aureimonas fodinaquatilis]|uniref:Cyclic di-GMP-binding protein n=1 Tax=Aureimonas fodinaquatilis TaxID=2565783 RepID=A0A5B0DNW7_9HYPH|nr:cellulose biosynthesis cyclic di-GMP-binding regulatory protein BcsB [Aureimonas fodinaquatilis]KAA0968444.1 cellulose biosynthesis cyclic di-GMP-binding regulatory protein BcsB [Aureimonas fodinaquatilis]